MIRRDQPSRTSKGAATVKICVIGVAAAVDRERSRARTALCDVREDCEELLAVARNGLVDLSSFADDLRGRSQVRRGTVDVLLEQATALATRYREISMPLLGLACRAGATLELDEGEIDRLAGERGECAGQLRALQSILAGLVVAPDWQSPSFPHCECVGVPSGAVARVAPVFFVRDSIPA